jgi:hypothetical protein
LPNPFHARAIAAIGVLCETFLSKLKLLKSKSRTKTELLKVSSARRRARQAALDALLAEGKVIRIDREYFANDLRTRKKEKKSAPDFACSRR